MEEAERFVPFMKLKSDMGRASKGVVGCTKALICHRKTEPRTHIDTKILRTVVDFICAKIQLLKEMEKLPF